MNKDNKVYLIYINIFIILISLLLINCQQEKRETTPNIPNTTNISVIDTIPIGYVWLKVGEKKLLVEIADTPEKRREGLMFRQELEENAGMLFVFDREDTHSFWMKNTYLPLSIAFIDEGGRILQIKKMKPLDEKIHYISKAPIRYALEVNQGWFEKYQINIGDTIHF